jgi:2-dehydropantoate 2-reductase
MAKVAIVGCGAMGSVYAALMSRADHEVFCVDTWTDHIAAINRKGLRVEGVSGDTLAAVKASVTPDDIGICDLIIIATKAFDAEAAAASIKPLIGCDSVVQTIQNGIGASERVAHIVGSRQLAVGVVGGFGASIVAPGHAHHNGMEMIRFGSYSELSRQHFEAAGAIWTSAGFQVAYFDDIKQMVWEKLIMNVAFSGTSFCTGLTIGEIIDTPDAWHIAQQCAEEAVAVAEKLGITLDVGDPIMHIQTLGGKIPNARPSMLLDHLQKRRSEIDYINGGVARLAQENNVPAPVNHTIVNIVKAREAHYGD